MNNKKRFDIYRVLSLVLLSILPIIAIIKGIELVKDGMILTNSIIFTFFVLPIIAVLLFVIILVKAKKTWAKVVMCFVVLIASIFCFVGFCGFQKYERINCYENEALQEQYAENTNAFMPALTEISKPEKLEYYHYEGSEFVFQWESKVLVCEYSEDEYLQNKTSLDEKYVFRIDDRANKDQITDIDGYSFRMLSTGEYETDFPKENVLIATNDATKEIVYLSFYDQDLDYIDSLDEFILDNCGWEHIR